MINGFHPYIVLNGNAAKAIEAYKSIFDAEVGNVMKYSDAPKEDDKPVDESKKDLVLNSCLKIGTYDIMISDGMDAVPGSVVQIAISFDNEEQTKKIFTALAANGKVIIELGKTFFAPLYGLVEDEFSVRWQIITVPESK